MKFAAEKPHWPYHLEVREADYSAAASSILVGATMKKIIDSFKGEHRFLNNFYESSIWYEGKQYRTCEHAYQAHKTTDESIRETIRNAKTPAEAKKLGHTFQVRPDWESVKLPLMRDFLRKKFENPFLRHMLLETDDSNLVYTNTWNDKYWGICRGVGQNWLGKLLEEIREEIKKEISKERELNRI